MDELYCKRCYVLEEQLEKLDEDATAEVDYLQTQVDMLHDQIDELQNEITLLKI